MSCDSFMSDSAIVWRDFCHGIYFFYSQTITFIFKSVARFWFIRFCQLSLETFFGFLVSTPGALGSGFWTGRFVVSESLTIGGMVVIVPSKRRRGKKIAWKEMHAWNEESCKESGFGGKTVCTDDSPVVACRTLITGFEVMFFF